MGAIFLEYGSRGYKKAYDFLIGNFEDEILEVNEKINLLNPKAILQEYTQGKNHDLPKYNLVKETGLEHDKTFFVEIEYHNKIIGKGSAKSIKLAHQKAASNALKKLGGEQ